MEVGRIVKYHFYQVCLKTKKWQINQTYSAKSLFYNHSFAVTKNYFILFKSPLLINKGKLILGLPFNNTLYYDNTLSSYFILINRNNGHIQEIETDPLVCLHTINSYEQGNRIIIDLVCHSGGNPYDKLYLSNLRAPNLTYLLGK